MDAFTFGPPAISTALESRGNSDSHSVSLAALPSQSASSSTIDFMTGLAAQEIVYVS